MITKGYKVLVFGPRGTRLTPYADKRYPARLGQWTPRRKRVVMCQSGWHLWNTKAEAIRHYNREKPKWTGRKPLMFLAEGRGYRAEGGSKTAYESIRLVKRLK